MTTAAAAAATPETSRALRATLWSLAWIVAWLALLDVGVRLGVHRIAARHPDSGLVRYFEYGRSIEGKLDLTTRLPPAAPDALILEAGWIDPTQWVGLPTAPAPGDDLLVALYGQSFAFNATREAVRLDGHLTLRGIGGPAAPPDHSYAAYVADDANRAARVVVFGILASSVPHMGAMSGADWTFEHPAPFTYPRFSLRDGRLEAEAPVLQTQAQFRAAFAANGDAWHRFKAQLARHDRGFDPLTFDRTFWDNSEIALMLRRGWVAHSQDYERGIYRPGTGFVASAEQIQVLEAMLVDLGRRTRARGQRLIVLLEQDQGYGDALYRALGPLLDGAHIEYISTHTLFSAADPRNFKADGHYSDAANELLAARLQATIRAAPPR